MSKRKVEDMGNIFCLEKTTREGSKAQLLAICKEACDEMAPMVRYFYDAMNGNIQQLKKDNSYFTIADGIVQYLLVQYLFKGGKFRDIVGEEDVEVNITTKPYTVGSGSKKMEVPEAFNEKIDAVRDAFDKLSLRVDAEAYNDVTVFIDPIDGTREFATGKGEQCTILIGFADETGRSCAGLVYRPVPESPVYAMGCQSENFTQHNMGTISKLDGLQNVTTNGSISSFVEALCQKGPMERVKSGGAGNKVMLVLEGKATCYISDRGVSRWDTCGPEAVINAFGGCLVKLNTITQDPAAFLALRPEQRSAKSNSYTYLKGEKNRDFIAGQAALTPYNVSDSAKEEFEAWKKSAGKGDKKMATRLDMVKPYANTAGLVALGPSEMSDFEKYVKIIEAAMGTGAQPSFD